MGIKSQIHDLDDETNKERFRRIREYIFRNKNQSVNQTMAALKKRGLLVTLDEVKVLRHQLFKTVEALRPAVMAVVNKRGATDQDVDDVMRVFNAQVLEAPFPAEKVKMVAPHDVSARLKAEEEERARKQKLREEREVRQQAERDARAAQWEKDRAKEREEAERIQKEADAVKAKEKEEADRIAREAEEALQAAEAAGRVELDKTLSPYMLDRLEVFQWPELTPERRATGAQDSLEGRKERDRWVEDFFLLNTREGLNPPPSSWEASAAMRRVFGIGRDLLVILNAMKTVRELNGLTYRGKRLNGEEEHEEEAIDTLAASLQAEHRLTPPLPPVASDHAPQPIPSAPQFNLVPPAFVAAPMPGRVEYASSAQAGVIPLFTPVTQLPMLLYWPNCGHPEFTSKEALNASIERLVNVVGVARESIRVFREVKTRTKIVVTVELDE